MNKIAFITVLGVFLAFSSTVHATALDWGGSGESGADPLGHTWVYLNNSNGIDGVPGGTNGSWGLPGLGEGVLPFQGDFVRDFHITFDLSSFPDQAINPHFSDSYTDAIMFYNIDDGIFWDSYIWDSDNDNRLDSVSFWTGPGGQLDLGEEFFVNVIFTQSWPTINFGETSVLVTPDFTASWTEDGTPIPEPATMFLLGTGLVGVAGAARRKKKNQA